MLRRSVLALCAAGCSEMALGGLTGGTPHWSLVAKAYFRADSGLVNRVAGSAYGNMVETGGSVDIAAYWPNGQLCFRFHEASGGYLVCENVVTQTQPFTRITVARAITQTNGRVVAGTKGGGGNILQLQTNAYRISSSTATLTTGVIDLSQPHIVDARWHSRVGSGTAIAQASRIGIDGAGYVAGGAFSSYPGFQAQTGLSLGAQGDGTLRSEVDVLADVFFDGLPPYPVLQQCIRELGIFAGIAAASPPSYGDPNEAPQLSSVPASWSGSPMLCFPSIGQSNEVGRAIAPTEAFGPACYYLKKNWLVLPAVYPIASSDTILDPAINDQSGLYAWHGKFGNTVAAATGRNVCFLPGGVSGTSVNFWTPGGTRAHAIDALISRILEAQHWGQEIGALIMSQGEADGLMDPAEWVSKWQTNFAYLRARCSLPSLPVLYLQTANGPLRPFQYLLEQADPLNLMLPTVFGANLEADNLHLNATGQNLFGADAAAAYLALNP